ncbi:PRC-barrel domain-containing protein [Micromonospora sp. NPDC049497]|uniref:PRC-barrel domain-containing protein n=1 Tax=Micromonospora sp. NPDC049497 TaxID=3364273 RepID=UPI003791E1F2
MRSDETPLLVRLGDTDQTVATDEQDIRGRHVTDVEGNELGKVDDLLIDRQEHRVRLLRVKHGGILGIGSTAIFVPVEAVSAVTEDTVRIDLSREQVSRAPVYDPEIVDGGHYADLYGYYGYAPFFAPSGIAPPYPVPPTRR